MSLPERLGDAVAAFRAAIGRRFVLTGEHQTKPYRTGYRGEAGPCLAVLRPGSLVELWQALELAVKFDLNIIMQAANTGLTGGSSPQGRYANAVVIIATERLSSIHLIDGGKQAICLPGSSLHKLEGMLEPLGREPHSVIGSSCLGASVIGGVCNNSGGSLVERGPAYTEYSVFARLGASGQLVLENQIGADLGETPIEILQRLEAGDFSETLFQQSDKMASDHEYKDWVRDIEAPSPARYNADPRRLSGASGCAGKLAVFAVRLDTFAKHDREETFFLGTNDASVLTDLRRTILSCFDELPVSAEYMDAETFAFAEKYGRDTVYLVEWIGTRRLPSFFKLKGIVESWLGAIPFISGALIEHVLQLASKLLPNPNSASIREIAKNNQHLLILKMKNCGIGEAEDLLNALGAGGALQVRRCGGKEARRIALHRFATAGAGVRYHSVRGGSVGDLLALDVALPRNIEDWRDQLPDHIAAQIDQRLYYGHFMCQVFHQDYVLKPGASGAQIKASMLEKLDERGAKYPAEHNVGHLYQAEPQLCEHYRELDPRNQFNPGIGKASKKRFYSD